MGASCQAGALAGYTGGSCSGQRHPAFPKLRLRAFKNGDNIIASSLYGRAYKRQNFWVTAWFAKQCQQQGAGVEHQVAAAARGLGSQREDVLHVQ